MTSTTEHGPAVAAAIEGELRLLDPAVRCRPDLVDELLHPDWQEFGASGRRWDRASMLAALAAGASPDDSPIVATRMNGVELAPDLVHLTFDTDHDGRHAHRSSLWRRSPDGRWRMYFHQGTLFTPAAD
ncbi:MULTISPECIES: DUF4440 domain-containing protein [unclassified Streptomyces]|uniref:nuclear transport factor 2 family protein n=1 Tax=unclassified Streptomyces TaxID=2593676 RepID=UPI003D7045FA